MPCECCGAGQVLVVLRGPGPAVAARAAVQASASARGTKRMRPLLSTIRAEGLRLGRLLSGGVALSGVSSRAGASSTQGSVEGLGWLSATSSSCRWSSSSSSSSPSLEDDSSSLVVSSALLSSASRDRVALVAAARHGRHHVKSWTRRQQTGCGCRGCLHELHAVRGPALGEVCPAQEAQSGGGPPATAFPPRLFLR
jgi:hypothetical protein